MIHWAGGDKSSGAAGQEPAEAARFVGQVFGYLAGPAKRPQPKREQQIAQRLAPVYLAACEAGKREALVTAGPERSAMRSRRPMGRSSWLRWPISWRIA